MAATDRFLASTRGRILTRLLRGPRTVADLAEEFGISTNAARRHFSELERDGYIERDRVKDTVTRPAAAYAVTPAGQALFPKAYAPVLEAVTEELADEFGADEVPDFLLNVGLRLGQKHAPPADATPEERIEFAIALLTDLGAVLDVGRSSTGAVLLEGNGCPLSGLVREHPEFCAMLGAMLEEITVLPVEPCCRNDTANPSCRFLIGARG